MSKTKKQLEQEIKELKQELHDWRETADFEGMNGHDLWKEKLYLEGQIKKYEKKLKATSEILGMTADYVGKQSQIIAVLTGVIVFLIVLIILVASFYV